MVIATTHSNSNHHKPSTRDELLQTSSNKYGKYLLKKVLVNFEFDILECIRSEEVSLPFPQYTTPHYNLRQNGLGEFPVNYL